MFLQIEILALFAASVESVGCNRAGHRFLAVRACRMLTLLHEGKDRTMMRNNGNDSLGEDQRSVEVRPRVEREFLIE